MTRSSPLVKLALVAVCLAFLGSPVASEEVAASQSMYGDTTREQILATRERRKNQLKIMVVDAENKLADHASGENILTEEEKRRLETQIDLFQRKIESMHVELEDWEIERLVARGVEDANRRRERSQRSRSINRDRIHTEL